MLTSVKNRTKTGSECGVSPIRPRPAANATMPGRATRRMLQRSIIRPSSGTVIAPNSSPKASAPEAVPRSQPISAMIGFRNTPKVKASTGPLQTISPVTAPTTTHHGFLNIIASPVAAKHGRRRRAASTSEAVERFLGGAGAGLIGAVHGGEEVERRRFAGKEQAIIDRRGEKRAIVGMTGPGVGIGTACKRISAPRRGGERRQLLADRAAAQSRQLVQRECGHRGKAVAFEAGGELAAEKALQDRPAE